MVWGIPYVRCWVKVWGLYTLRSTKVDDVSVLLEHVNLLDGLDGLDVHLLQGGLELLVVGTGGLVDLLDLAAGSTLASVVLLVSLRAFWFVDWVGLGSGDVCVSWDANVCHYTYPVRVRKVMLALAVPHDNLV